MEKTFVYNGYIQTKDSVLIFNILKSFLKPSNLRERYASDIQKEIKYENENLDIYIYDDFNDGFLFNTQLNGTFEEAQNFINILTEKLRERNTPHQFEWNEIDESDEQIGEEYEIKFMNE